MLAIYALESFMSRGGDFDNIIKRNIETPRSEVNLISTGPKNRRIVDDVGPALR